MQLTRGVFLKPAVTSYSTIAHMPEMQFWTTQKLLCPPIVTNDLVHFLD